MAGAALGTTYRHLRDLFAAGSTLGQEDGQLLARYARSGNPAAFEALVIRHGPMVLATCRAVLKGEHDAEDAFQATFLVLARKAGSIRAADTLGGWLHRVAYRVSVQAGLEAVRRRRKEAEVAIDPEDISEVRPESNLAALLHEEIDRLPGPLRLAVVLRDLEGLSYEDAALRLGWTLPRFRHRLAEARQRLKTRLDRRNDFPLALGIGAAVPSALVRSAVASAGGSAPPASVTLLAHILFKGMLMTRIKIFGTAALSALALASAGLMAFGSGTLPDEPKPALKASALPERKAEGAPTAGLEVELKGRVVGPDGAPIAGAKVTPAFYDRESRPQVEAISGLDGRFSIRLPRSKRQASMDWDVYPWLVASASGFGPGWAAGVMKDGGLHASTIRLVEPGRTIEGRLIDLEGRPLAGVRVAAKTLYFAKGPGGRADEAGDLSAWLAARRESRTGRARDGLAALPAEGISSLAATTGLDGRFRLDGVGRERIAELLASGPSIVSTEILAMTRETGEVRAVNEALTGPEPVVFHSPRFDQPIAPSKPIRGFARDKDTGKPIAGLTIRGDVYDVHKNLWAEGIEATTGLDGGYILTGLPKAPAYRLFATTAPGLPYPNAQFKVEATASPGLEPLAFDFALKRGVVIRGRVTDKATGRPVAGHVNAFTFANSPGIDQYPGLAQSYPIFAYLDDDGRYETVAPAGRIIVACQSDIRRYIVARGAETIAGHDPKKSDTFRTVPSFRGAVNYHVLAEIRLDPGADPATLDLQVDPGRTVELNVEDPEGRPIGGLKAEGTSQTLLNTPIMENSSTVEVRGLDPSSPRRVVVFHDGRKLVGSVYLKGDESSPLTLRLQPWGTVVGRVVDDEGKPARSRSITAGNNTRPVRLEEVGIFPGGSIGGGLPLDKDGRFRLEGLVPALKYAASACDTQGAIVGDLFKDVTVGSGETKDLGDLKVTPYKP